MTGAVVLIPGKFFFGALKSQVVDEPILLAWISSGYGFNRIEREGGGDGSSINGVISRYVRSSLEYFHRRCVTGCRHVS